MKFSYAGALVALTLASLLTACGGKAQYTVQGSVSGLTVDGLQLKNGNQTVDVPKGATSFAFPQQIDYGSDYEITIAKNPEFFTCQVVGGKGSAGYTVSIASAVNCTPDAYTVGGTYSGLVSVATTTDTTTTPSTTKPTPNKVVLINGSGAQTEVSSETGATGSFTAATLTNGQVYSISILKQPDRLTCTLTNASGVIRAPLSVGNLILTCGPST